MKLEISVKSAVPQSDLYELRNFLVKEIDDLDITIKEHPPQEGQMVIGVIEPILLGVLNTIITTSAQDLYNDILKPKLLEWLKEKAKKDGKNPEIISTLTTDSQSVHFMENRDGETISLTNFKYSIDKNKTQVILIGNSEYENDFPAIPPVKGNLEDMYAILTDISLIGIPKENVTILFNKNNYEIEESLLRKSKISDIQTLIIYFAGHGYRADVKKLYLIAKNTKRINEYILSGVDFDFINNEIIKNSKASQKLLILDACHSGIAAQGPNDLAENIEVKGTYVLASSSGDEVSYFNSSKRNTYFTEAIVNVFKNGLEDSQEMVALDDLYERTKQNQVDKNLSIPIFKNGLNIPASNFFLSRNPSFSQQKQKLRPYELFKQGLLEEALLEYRVLLSKYPEDAELRKEANLCENEILFQEILIEADELYSQNNYKQAIEKYQKILRIKNDPGVSYKLNKSRIKLEQADSVISSASAITPPTSASSSLTKEETNKPLVKDNAEVSSASISEITVSSKFKLLMPNRVALLIIYTILILSMFLPWNSYDNLLYYSLSGKSDLLYLICVITMVAIVCIIFFMLIFKSQRYLSKGFLFRIPLAFLVIFAIMEEFVWWSEYQKYSIGFWIYLICSLYLFICSFFFIRQTAMLSNKNEIQRNS